MIDASWRSSVVELVVNHDARGDLAVAEFPESLPFVPKRCFFVTGVPVGEKRGIHAHHACHQFLVCLRGRVGVSLDEGSGRIAEVELATPERGVWIPPYVWGGQTYLDPDAVLFVAASDPYDAADYIVDYDEFSLLVAQLPRESP